MLMHGHMALHLVSQRWSPTYTYTITLLKWYLLCSGIKNGLTFQLFFSVFLLEKIQQTKIKLVFMLFMLVEVKLISMLLMPQPICERCW
jgi:hypothetical protein